MSFEYEVTEDMALSSRIESLQFGEKLEKMPKSFWRRARKIPPKLKEVWRSRDFMVQVYDESRSDYFGLERLSIQKTTVDLEAQRFEEGITWDQIQDLKSQCGRGDRMAVEIYPPDQNIVNVANMRHIWVMKQPLSFMWGGKR